MIKKYFFIIVINIILFFIFLVISDFFYYSVSLIQHNKFNFKNLKNIYSGNNTYITDIKGYFNGTTNDYRSGRLPDGLQYKGKPIVIFGCSFAFGQNLRSTETFSYLLSEILKRPVYNRAMCGTGFQHMYFQSTSEYFYEDVPPSDTVIYVVINDHFQRLSGEPFYIHENWYYLHYIYKNNTFYQNEYKNFISIFIKKSYTLKFFRKIIKGKYIHNKNNEQKITNEALAYFIKTRQNLENRWQNKINFIVFFIDDYDLYSTFIPKLINNDFKVIYAKDLSDNTDKKEFWQPNGHPNGLYWKNFTPIFVSKLKQKNLL